MARLSPKVVERVAQLDRRFEGVEWLLSRIPILDVPSEWIVYGERILGPSVQRLDATRFNSPDICEAASEFLEAHETEQVISNFYDDEDRKAAQLYKGGGNAQSLGNDFDRLRSFYAAAAENGDAAIISIW